MLLGLAALAVIVGVLNGCGGGRDYGRGAQAGSDQPLVASIVSRVDSLGLDAPSVRVVVPFRSLVFQKVADEYRAGILVQVVARRDEEQVGGGVDRAEVRLPTDQDTRGHGELSCVVPLVITGDAEVDLEVTVTGWQTSRIWRRLLTYSPRAVIGMPIYFRHVTWNLPAADATAPLLGLDIDTLHATIDLGRTQSPEPWPAEGVELVFRIKPISAEGDLVNRIRVTAADVGPAGLKVPVHLGADQIPFGRAELHLELTAELDADRAVLPDEAARRFVNLQLQWRDERQWRQQVTWLDGLVPEPEQDRLSELALLERPAAWDTVWAQLAREEATEVREAQRAHLLRIIEADDRFGRFGRGSLSDRGRVLIRYAEPTRIDRHAGDAAREQQWEVWYYSGLGLRFTFVDQHGLGDYRLQETREY